MWTSVKRRHLSWHPLSPELPHHKENIEPRQVKRATAPSKRDVFSGSWMRVRDTCNEFVTMTTRLPQPPEFLNKE
ncbi:hypothetical protein TNCV_4416981 [Trichonephila clavipes]|uniref:Uncharacterized protein n=1 Tax=Trichonephila clavipes TaxID=2585209 RepID=A0A8X6S4U0_TRICX|nr:hypothetical protein TNCV_4416981 [Trichonephila clavipes]